MNPVLQAILAIYETLPEKDRASFITRFVQLYSCFPPNKTGSTSKFYEALYFTLIDERHLSFLQHHFSDIYDLIFISLGKQSFSGGHNFVVRQKRAWKSSYISSLIAYSYLNQRLNGETPSLNKSQFIALDFLKHAQKNGKGSSRTIKTMWNSHKTTAPHCLFQRFFLKDLKEKLNAPDSLYQVMKHINCLSVIICESQLLENCARFPFPIDEDELTSMRSQLDTKLRQHSFDDILKDYHYFDFKDRE